MSIVTRFAGSVFALAATVTLVSAATAQAHASDIKPVTIKMPAAALADPAAKLCMPRTVIDKSKHSTLPKTVCQTQAEWAAQGVNIVARK